MTASGESSNGVAGSRGERGELLEGSTSVLVTGPASVVLEVSSSVPVA